MKDDHVIATAPTYPKFNFDKPPVLEPDEAVTAARLREGSLVTRRRLALREGGAGSGNYGHLGRPGSRGGSAPGMGALINKANKLAATEGGFTLSLTGEAPLKDGYGVGGAVTPLDVAGYKAGDDLTPHIVAFVGKHEDTLMQKGHFLGGWHDTANDVFSIDVAQNVNMKDAALALASSRGEKAIWDVANGTEIRLYGK